MMLSLNRVLAYQIRSLSFSPPWWLDYDTWLLACLYQRTIHGKIKLTIYLLWTILQKEVKHFSKHQCSRTNYFWQVILLLSTPPDLTSSLEPSFDYTIQDWKWQKLWWRTYSIYFLLFTSVTLVIYPWANCLTLMPNLSQSFVVMFPFRSDS